MSEEQKTTVTTKSVQNGYGVPSPIVTIAILVIIVILTIVLLLIVVHALPLLDDFLNGLKPLAWLLGYCTGLALLAMLGLSVWYVYGRFKVDVKRRSIEARLFHVDQHGNYAALYRETTEMFVVPKPSATIQPVPGNFSPRIHIVSNNDAQSEAVEASPLTAMNITKPQVTELAQRIERNSLQLCLGRSLLDGSYLISDISETHGKIIGGTRMGKSCQAGAILEQVQMTHDPTRLRFALLDMERKTCRLFEGSDHLAIIADRPCIARNVDEVPVYLHFLAEELERRDRLSYQELERLPHILIYIEEFLNLKKQIKASDRKTCNQFLTDFNTLMTRGLKLGFHVLICAQVDYADDDLKESMAQFLGLNMAFGVKPEAARAAGFISSELLSRNYETRVPGQFVLEMLGGCDLGIAPDYDVKEKIKAISDRKTKLLRNTDQNTLDPALQAKLAQVMEVPGESMKNCIKRVWGATPGDNQGWHNAKAEYEEIQKQLYALALKGMERQDQP